MHAHVVPGVFYLRMAPAALWKLYRCCSHGPPGCAPAQSPFWINIAVTCGCNMCKYQRLYMCCSYSDPTPRNCYRIMLCVQVIGFYLKPVAIRARHRRYRGLFSQVSKSWSCANGLSLRHGRGRLDLRSYNLRLALLRCFCVLSLACRCRSGAAEPNRLFKMK